MTTADVRAHFHELAGRLSEEWFNRQLIYGGCFYLYWRRPQMTTALGDFKLMPGNALPSEINEPDAPGWKRWELAWNEGFHGETTREQVRNIILQLSRTLPLIGRDC